MRRHIVYLADSPHLHSSEILASTTNAFFLSHDIRRDVRLYIATPNYAILLDGSTIRLLRPDAQSTRGLLKKAQESQRGGSRRMPRGFSLLNDRPNRLLTHLPNVFLCYPSQKGREFAQLKLRSRDPALIVGEDRGKALEAAEASDAVPIRLSRWPLPPSHEIVLFNILLDRMGTTDEDSARS